MNEGEENGYRFIDEKERWKMNVMNICGIKRKHKNKQVEGFSDEDVMKTRRMIEMIIHVCVNEGIEEIVVGDFGCEKNGNPGKEISRIWKEMIQEYSGYLKSIHFGNIQTNTKTKTNEMNMKVFKQILIESGGKKENN